MFDQSILPLSLVAFTVPLKVPSEASMRPLKVPLSASTCPLNLVVLPSLFHSIPPILTLLGRIYHTGLFA